MGPLLTCALVTRTAPSTRRRRVVLNSLIQSIHVATSVLSDVEENSSEDSVPSSGSDWCFEDDIFSSNLCTCGAGSRAHKKDCVMSSRNRYPGSVLFPKDPTIDHVPPRSDKVCRLNEPDPVETKLLLLRREDQALPHLRLENMCVYIVTGWISSMSLAVWYE